MAIQQISKAEFDAFGVPRGSLVGVAFIEEEFFRDDPGNIIGVVTHDVADDDWGWAAIGRDEHGTFRAFANDVSFPSLGAAREALLERMQAEEAAGATVFPQGD